MSYTSSPHDVKAGAFEQAVDRFETAGFLLAKYETLWKAIKDRRLDRPTLFVLAELVEGINRETMTTWLSRETIAERVGVAVKSVSNSLSQLKALGYVMAERRETPQANNRVLLHYTLTALSPEEIEAAITRTVQSLRGRRESVVALARVPARTGIVGESSRQDGNTVPAGTGTDAESSRQDGKSLPARTGIRKESSRQDGTESSRQDGRSNLVNRNLVSEGKGKVAPAALAPGRALPLDDEPDAFGGSICHDAFSAYNALAQRIGLPIAMTLTPQRRQRLKARLREVGGLAAWNRALERVEGSSFLRGQNDRGWTADFDFLLQASRLPKVIEGAYDDQNRKPKRAETFHDRLRKLAESGEGA